MYLYRLMTAHDDQITSTLPVMQAYIHAALQAVLHNHACHFTMGLQGCACRFSGPKAVNDIHHHVPCLELMIATYDMLVL